VSTKRHDGVRFAGRGHPTETQNPASDSLAHTFSALFVTWNTTSHLRSNKKPALRGCIGNFGPMPLAQGLREYALIR
jgi:AMMECR1 domain-containing protein